MAAAITSRMMPLETPSAPGEKCSSLVSRPPRTSRSTATMAAVVSIFAQHPPLECLRHGCVCLQERHQRDLGTDPDQQQQERIDDECSVQRFEVLHRAPSSMVGGPLPGHLQSSLPGQCVRCTLAVDRPYVAYRRPYSKDRPEPWRSGKTVGSVDRP